MNITKPIIRKIKDNETALAEFEKEIKTNEAEDTKDIIMNFPTVYIHNWPETNKYDVYVGESNNIFARTRQHYHNRIKVNKEKNLQTYELCMNQLKYNERIYRIKNKQEAWEGLTWVLPLLNINPMKALKALGMYFDAECIYMPDDRIYGISDAMDIIEEKYIKSASDKNAYIFSLTSREFEILIAILYEALGYKVNLTKATRDGGKDIIAEINENERKEKVFVECKLYKTCELKKETVRALGYTMLSEEATRAVIFTSGYATKALKEMDTRIQIFDMEEMILLLNANLGERWYADFERLKSNFMKEMS